MRLTYQQVKADKARMEKFICERIPDDGTRIDLGGGAWANLLPSWDDRFGWDLLLETDEPEWVDLVEVYQHFRRKEMTSREWRGELLQPSNLGKSTAEGAGTTSAEDRIMVNEAMARIEDRFQTATKLIAEQLSRIESNLGALVQQRTIKDWYTTKEVAVLLGKKEYTIREWCRLRRIYSKKLAGGRGNEGEWRISHEELLRIQTEGLLPIPLKY